MTHSFRDFMFDLDDPRLADSRDLTPREYAEFARTHSFLGPLIAEWAQMYAQPYSGVSFGGELREEVWDAFGGDSQMAADHIATMVSAAEEMLASLDDSDRSRVQYPIGAHEWRSWANPEFIQHDTGLRLEDHPDEVVESILDLVKVSLGPTGWARFSDAMFVNGFLGEITDLPALMNDRSYNFGLFGEPGPDQPWGWVLFGHHAAASCLVTEGRLFVAPVFLGAEPSVVDVGPRRGLEPFARHVTLAVDLLASLDPDQRAAAVFSDDIVDPALPAERWHPGDERVLLGCFRDNQDLPAEGLKLDTVGADVRQHVLDLVREFMVIGPDFFVEAWLDLVQAHLDETWLYWMGGSRVGEPFYVRVASPVIGVELDHHKGIFLKNDAPQPFHIHTMLRAPNGNDYGRRLVAAVVDEGSPLPGDIDDRTDNEGSRP